MKEVKVVFGSGGRVKLLAEGVNGKGTKDFTLELAKSLGRIVERHRGPQHVQVHAKSGHVHTHERRH